MATSSFDRPFVLQDDEAVLKFLEAMEHPMPPITPERRKKLREMLERGEELVKKMSFR
jgi:hypothetical protein